jgi:sec-independent protein translocase protein TatB
MFDIGFLELVLVAIVGLLVLGPERLPQAIRTGSLWLGKLRRNFNAIKTEIDRELNSDEIKRELHNQSILESLESTSTEIHREIDDIQQQLSDTPYDISDVVNTDANAASTVSSDDKHKK